MNFVEITKAATSTVRRRIAVASAIAALLVAAIVLLTPNMLFERFIVATGLPGLIDAAAPPLAIRARLAFAIIAAFGVAAFSFGGLSIIASRKRTKTAKDLSTEDEFFAFTPPAPRRRADSHPDSPPRRPINAGDDLGTPLDLVEIVTEDFEIDDVEDEDVERGDPALGGSTDPVWQDDFDTDAEFSREFGQSEDPTASVESFDDECEAEYAPESEQPTEEHFSGFGNEADLDPNCDDQTSVLSERIETGADYDADQIESAPTENAPHSQDGLIDLVERLEAGFKRRRDRTRRAANDAPIEPSNVTPYPVTRSGQDGELQGALREALDALQKLNANG